ncbi:MAG: hypothetical protein ACXW15_06565 [Acidimicrobiia bacterium]
MSATASTQTNQGFRTSSHPLQLTNPKTQKTITMLSGWMAGKQDDMNRFGVSVVIDRPIARVWEY